MTSQRETPPRGERDGVGLTSSLESIDNDEYPTNSPTAQVNSCCNPRAVREAKRQLRLDFLHECAGGIQIHAALIQTFAEIGDTAGACHALRRLFAHAKAAHPVYVEMRDEADSGGAP